MSYRVIEGKVCVLVSQGTVPVAEKKDQERGLVFLTKNHLGALRPDISHAAQSQGTRLSVA